MAAPTRWGILGPGRIAADFCTCLRSMPEHEIVAVASRNKERADQFASQFNIAHAYNTYQEVINNPDVDIVYISTIPINHVELSLACIEAGKNVLSEKPMSLSLEGCKRVLGAARKRGVLFVEGYWTRFFPALQFIKEQIASGELGEVRSVQGCLAQPLFHIENVKNKELGGGGLMVMGCYPIVWANTIFKGKPELIQAHGSVYENGADKAATITLKYPGNKYATMMYDTGTSGGASSLTIRGTKGNLVIPDQMWCPSQVLQTDRPPKVFQLPTVDTQDGWNFLNSQGFCYQIQGIRDCLLKGLKESPHIPHEDSETIMYILTQVQKQLGVSYDCP